MTSAALATPFFASGQDARRKRGEVTKLGVFSDGRGWKGYSQFAAATAYPSRQEALAAAEARALAAAEAGRIVELFVEHEDGSLAQAWPQ